MKAYRIVMVLVGLFVFGFSTSHAQMMMGQGGKQGMMGQGKGMMCDKMGMMGKGGKTGMMGMMQGMGTMGEKDMMHNRYMKKGLHFYFKNREALGLTDKQIEKLDDIKITFKKSYILEKARLKVAGIELEELLDKDSISMKNVEKKVKEIASFKEGLILLAIKTRVEAKKVLTYEQREKAKKLMYSRKGSGQMMRSGMGMGSQKMMSDDMSMEGMKLKQKEEGHEEHH